MKLNFNKNLGNEERVIRAGIGAFLLVWAYFKSTSRRKSLFLKMTALSQFMDAMFSYCVLHDLMGWSTRKRLWH